MGLGSLQVWGIRNQDNPRLALRADGSFGSVGTCFVDMLEFICLPEKEFAVHQGGAERATTEAVTLTHACVERMLQQQFPDGNSVSARLRHFVVRLQENGVVVQQSKRDTSGDFSCLPNTALQIPVGVGYLAAQAKWRTLALGPKAKWDADCDAYSLHEEVKRFAASCELQGSVLANFVPPAELQPSHQLFSALADDLCEWSTAIISASHDPERTTSGLEQYVIWLNSPREATSQSVADHTWDSSTRPSFGKRSGATGAYNPTSGSRGRFRALFLVQCLLFALHLKESSSISQALNRAFSVLPDYWCKTLQACFATQCLPSGATISRARLSLDSAFMVCMRRQLERLLVGFCLFHAHGFFAAGLSQLDDDRSFWC